MPRASKVTYKLVATAARSLMAGNRNPTVVTLKQVLEGGSTDLISKYLREWRKREQIQPEMDTPFAIEPPPEWVREISERMGAVERKLTEVDARDAERTQVISLEMQEVRRRLAQLEARSAASAQGATNSQPDKSVVMAEAQRLRNEGMTAKQVASTIGMSVRWVQLHTYSPKRWQASTADQKALAAKMRKEGASIAEISRVTGRSWSWAREHATKTP